MKKLKSVKTSASQPMLTNDFAVALSLNNEGLLKSLDICMPVCVYSYEREKHKVVVVPLVKQAYFQKEWKYIDRVPFEVRMHSFKCGGFAMDFPVFVGDTGWVFSSDRDTSFLKDEEAPTVLVLGKDRELGVVEDVLPQPAKQPRIHSLPDGFFIPDNWGKWEYQRFKDSDDIKLKDSLYIGTSFYDEDEEKAPEGSEGSGSSKKDDDDKDKEDSDDDTYEGNPSASLVFTRDGSINIMTSSKDSDKKKSHFKMRKDRLDLKMTQTGKNDGLWEKIESSVSLEEGIMFDCKGDKSNYSFTLDKNGIEMKYNAGGTSEDKTAIITLTPSLDVHIATSGDVFMSAGNVTTECENITVTGDDTVFNVANVTGTVGKMTINSSGDLDIRSSSRVSIASEEGVSIGSAGNIEIGGVGSTGDINITSFGGSLHVSAVGSDDGGMTFESPNGTITMDKDGVSIKGETIKFTGDVDFQTNTGKLNKSQFISDGALIIT